MRSKRRSNMYQLANNLCVQQKHIMPWYNGDFPPSYKNQPEALRAKAVEIANALLEEGTPEGIAIATGLKQAREFFAKEEKKAKNKKVRQSKRN